MRMDKGKPFMHVEADDGSAPTFSEGFLYEAVGKGDARFILGVAEEYEHVITALGPKAVRAILDIKPRLVQRLGLSEKIEEWLEDARDFSDIERERRFPSQVILDDNAAEAIWRILHAEYCRYYNPEEAMDRDVLRSYHTLTDSLGKWEKDQRQKEQDKLPEKLERQAKVKQEQQAKRERERQEREAHTETK